MPTGKQNPWPQSSMLQRDRRILRKVRSGIEEGGGVKERKTAL